LLPPIIEQNRIAEVLLSADEVIVKYKNILNDIKDLELSVLNDLLETNKVKTTIDSEFNVQLGKMLSQKSREGESQYPYLANFNVQWNTFVLDKLNYMNFNEKERKKFQLQKGDILICEGGEVGRCAIWQNEYDECYYQKALHRLRPKNQYSPHILLRYMQWASNNGLLRKLTGHSTIAHLPAIRLKQFEIPVLDNQETSYFEKIFSIIDKNKQNAINVILAKNETISSLINYYLGGAN
jgi:type I restriction enzyme S subunit